MNTKEFKQSTHPFLRGLSNEHLEILATCAMRTRFTKGALVFQEGDLANRFYLINSGKISLHPHGDRNEEPLQTIGRGDVLGWSWLFPPNYWRFDATAEEDTDATFLHGSQLLEYMEQDKSLGFEILKRISAVVVDRLQATRARCVQQSSECAVPHS